MSNRVRATIMSLGLAVLILITLGIILFFGIAIFTQPIETAGDKFMNALRDDNYAEAFMLSANNLQKQIVDPDGLKQSLHASPPALIPEKWIFTSRFVTSQMGQLDGTVNLKDGTIVKIRLVFD